MSEELRLYAYVERECELADGDARFIAEQLGAKIRISRSVDGERYRLNPQQFIGVVVLPSGRRLMISPRISTSNILYMLAVAYTFPTPFFAELDRFKSLDELLEPVAEFFADLVDERIRSGLHRAYVETEDNLRVLRGRIDFPRDLAYNSVLRDRLYCRYAELTWDIPENQIVRYVCYRLSGWTFRRKPLSQRLTTIFHQLDEVALRPFGAIDAESFTYNRLNEAYRRIHRLCALFLDSASLSEAAGGTEFRTFLLDMNLLFERFVTQALLDRVQRPWSISPQEEHYLATRDRVRLRPDLVIRREDRVWAAADCKYKPIGDQSQYLNHDYYQVLAYCTSLNVPRGILIYPKHEVPLADELHIYHSDAVIRRLAIDLRGTPADLRRQMAILAEELVSEVVSAEDTVA